MIALDYQDRRPIYEQVVERFRHLILSEALPPGERMPSVRQLAVELSINPNTIQRAYMELEQEGLIFPVKGKGNYIADSAEIRRIGRENYCQELHALVNKGKNMGVGEEEMIALIRDSFREEEEA